ncbi:MAG TPA: chromate efflux transporter [Hyphomonadaceae bacterium]|nr:chromate efflux transporter [Hyphomonadaceae bacterium]
MGAPGTSPEQGTEPERAIPAKRSPLAVLLAFLQLGLTSFGGPVAHIGYFRHAFVVRRAWLTEQEFADLVALGQFLPGPASSQVGFAIGLREAGLAGGIAAFVGFTAPSAILMLAAAAGLGLLPDGVRAAVFHGLVLVAVPTVAHAVTGMARSLCNTITTAIMAIVSASMLLLVSQVWAQPAVIAAGALAGLMLIRGKSPPQEARAIRVPGTAIACLAAFAALLVALPLAAQLTGSPTLLVADAFYRSGALVFGGGHVVLPLLEAETVGRHWLDTETFLSGYGAAQALPGPLFSFAAYLGATADTGLGPMAGGLIALVAIFLPGLLVMAGALPMWGAIRSRAWATGMMRGASAAVVGVLAAALYTPVLTSGVRSPLDAAIAGVGFVALMARAPPWLVVVGVALAGAYSSLG